jgi:hypothetical protein
MNSITVSVAWLGTLLVAFVAKQFVADFLLQTTWMALGKAQKQDWLAPLATHAGIHAAFTFILMLAFRPSLWWLAIVDFVVHATIDRAKALATRKLGLTLQDSPWWWLLGFDQALHELTHLAIILTVLATA